MGYTEAFKEQMVKRMLGPPAVSAAPAAEPPVAGEPAPEARASEQAPSSTAPRTAEAE
ncbi:hypothetical protein [Archangium violaceum]|uniref:hypothetical protein n=1 Tax=Archangium violaceum TaxID=83451 RepID=UPI0036DA0241